MYENFCRFNERSLVHPFSMHLQMGIDQPSIRPSLFAMLGTGLASSVVTSMLSFGGLLFRGMHAEIFGSSHIWALLALITVVQAYSM